MPPVAVTETFDVDGLDWLTGGDRQSLAGCRNKYTVATTVMPPLDTMPTRNRLHFLNPPIGRIALHFLEVFVGLRHGDTVLIVVSDVNSRNS